MKLTTPFNFLAQKLLYTWIDTDVAQAPPITPDENPDENTVVIYVLSSRAWSDLLVVEQECKRLGATSPQTRIRYNALHRWHHVYTVAPANPLKAWLQQTPKRSRLLKGMIDAVKNDAELDVLFVPVVVFWGRPVLKQKHWLRVLFSETWGLAGRTRRFFTILFNGKSTLLQFSPAISLRALIDTEHTTDKTDEQLLDELQGRLSDRLVEMKTATLGPDISHRRTLVNDLLDNPSVVDAIEDFSDEHGISTLKAARKANRYLEEIVADRSYVTIQILQRILTAFWNRFYAGIDVYASEPIKNLALSHELVYVPCHRSHIDYLLLSYVIHFEGLAIPYIAAGKNLNMPLIGPVLRKGGAFFIRRSFKGNRLYSTVMFEYLASQLSTGMPIEYFIEGGRSRTGRLLQPKPGMLAMTIRAFLKYQERPVAFVPVYIGYEKMIESKSYLAELKGDDKKSETLIGSIRSFFRIRGFYGRVTTSFGEPVILNDILTELDADWSQQNFDAQQRPEWLHAGVKKVARQIMRGINASCAVNAVNLISTALLASPNQTMDEKELINTLTLYIKLIEQTNYSSGIVLPSQTAEQLIGQAEALALVNRSHHELGDFIYLDNAHAILLTYYRNNVLHLFVMPALIACCFTNVAALSKEKIVRFLKITYPFLKRELFLPWKLSTIETVIEDVLHCMADDGILNYSEGSDIYSKPPISTRQHAQLSTMAQIISPILELYYMIFALLAEHGSDRLSRERLEQLCHLMAQRLSLMYEINSPDFFDKKLIANFIDSLIHLGYVTLNQRDNLELGEFAIKEGRYARRLLEKHMQYNILQMLRASDTDT